MGRKLDFESWYPTIVSVALVFWLAILFELPATQFVRSAVAKGATVLMPSALNVGAVAIGFLATALSVLLSMADSSIVKLMRANGHYRRLIGFFRASITTSFLWVLVSAILSAVNIEQNFIWSKCILLFGVYLSISSILCYYRASGILLEILVLESPVSKTAVPEWRADQDAKYRRLDLADQSDKDK